MNRCIAGECYSDTRAGRSTVVAEDVQSGWQWHTGPAVPAGEPVELLQQAGDLACAGPVSVVVAAAPLDSAAHLVAILDWGHGGARFRAILDAQPGQSVLLLGASYVQLRAGWVDVPGRVTVSAALVRSPRPWGAPHLSTPALPVGMTELWIPPFARALRISGALEWRRGVLVVGSTTATNERAIVPGTADRVRVTLGAVQTAVWELAI